MEENNIREMGFEVHYDVFKHGLIAYIVTIVLVVLKLSGYIPSLPWLAVLAFVWVPGAIIHLLWFAISGYYRIMSLIESFNNHNNGQSLT